MRIVWSKKENDFVIYSPRKSDGHFVHSAILAPRLMTLFKSTWKEESFKDEYTFRYYDGGNPNIVHVEWKWLQELARRGFDITTMKFEITIKKEELADRFEHLWEDLTDKEKAEAIRLGFVSPKKSA